jgi:hypothetical protein
MRGGIDQAAAQTSGGDGGEGADDGWPREEEAGDSGGRAAAPGVRVRGPDGRGADGSGRRGGVGQRDGAAAHDLHLRRRHRRIRLNRLRQRASQGRQGTQPASPRECVRMLAPCSIVPPPPCDKLRGCMEQVWLLVLPSIIYLLLLYIYLEKRHA